MKTRRSRNLAKWALTATAALSFVLWIASGIWTLSRIWTTSPGITTFMIVRGEFYCARLTRFKEGDQPLSLDRNPLGPFNRFHWGFLFSQHPGTIAIAVPLWAPTLLTAAPAVLLWYADRRRFGPGLCTKCGYDRRGLALGVACPECGTGGG